MQLLRFRNGFTILWLFLCKPLFSQPAENRFPTTGILRSNLIATGAVFATGNFSSTHSVGFSVEYSRCHNSYGKSKSTPPVLLSYAVNAGINVFSGRKETVSGYSYKYPGNSWLYAQAGIMLLPVPSVTIGLTAGPALMLYNSNTNFALGSKLELNYFVENRISLSPLIQILKEVGGNSLWAAGLKGGFTF